MQLTTTTDYAIRAVLFLAMKGVANATELNEAMGIPHGYISSLARKLRDAGIIKSERGVCGGYSLNKPPEEISLLDIVELMEGTTKINRCLEADHYCSRNAADTCPVRKFYSDIQVDLEAKLRSKTIKDLMD